MKKTLAGREKEQEILADFLGSNRPEFLAIYGRRRIGKTYLVKEFFAEKECVFFNATGVQRAVTHVQINRFVKEIGNVFYKGIEIKEPRNWLKAFDLLMNAINQFIAKDQKIILFFDEFPWMATHKSGLLQILEHTWNQYWSNDPRIKLVICGSSASWIINKIINNKGGLHNRITRKIQLKPFTLQETKAFLSMQGITITHRQITQLYMVTGGIPYYLLTLKKGFSVVQFIEQLAFQQDSLLFAEFDNLFASLFSDEESYVELLRIITESRYGIGQEAIAKRSRLSSGGRLIKKLTELEEAGFIISFIPHSHKKRGVYYRMIDEYTLFYLDWIEPVRKTLQKHSLEKGYWEKEQSSARWHSWAGYAFESICYKHISQIRKKLNINPSAISDSWRYAPSVKSDQGAQIDLLFDRNDDCITVCEIKYTENPFVIDKSYAQMVQRKINVFREKTRTKKQILFAIVSATGLKETIYSEEIVHGVVTLEDFFNQNDQ